MAAQFNCDGAETNVLSALKSRTNVRIYSISSVWAVMKILNSGITQSVIAHIFTTQRNEIYLLITIKNFNWV